MIKSYRTKRRKIQEEICLLTSNNKEVILNAPQSDNNFLPSPELVTDNISNTNEKTPEKTDNSESVSVLTNDSLNLSTNNGTTKIDLQNKIASWSVECNVPHTTLNKLLKILKEEDYLPLKLLPLDSRTLLNIKSTITTDIKEMNPGIYYHFGLENGIINNSKKITLDNVIKIVIGVDGLPLSKSSSSQLWPILGYIHPHHENVFPIGIYHGDQKPSDSNDYLKYFIDECKILFKNGIIVGGVLKKIIIFAFCCDAPAKSFVMKVKGHTGFSSCTRCFQSGEFLQNRTCFPYSAIRSKKRDHNGYLNMIQANHHLHGGVTSNLIELPNFDIVKSFPLDYMHLVMLGVMRKLLNLWLSKGPVSVRLPAKQASKISELLLSLKPCIPIEFARKPRSLIEISRWKATEFRQFLLYTGPVVLKKFLSEDCYSNFMTLNIAMIILLSPNQNDKIDYADKLLNYFVKSFQHIYGSHYISHNVHGLLHIVDDYRNFGPLDFCSCFPFENFMKILKTSIRKHDLPLQQIIRRYHEKCSNDIIATGSSMELNSKTVYHHNLGPLIENITCGPQFVTLKVKNFTIKLKSTADRFVLTFEGDIVTVVNIAHLIKTNEQVINGYKFLSKQPFYENPLKSSKLNIYIVQNKSTDLQYWKITDIHSKVMILVSEDQQIAIPLIHSSSVCML